LAVAAGRSGGFPAGAGRAIGALAVGGLVGAARSWATLAEGGALVGGGGTSAGVELAATGAADDVPPAAGGTDAPDSGGGVLRQRIIATPNAIVAEAPSRAPATFSVGRPERGGGVRLVLGFSTDRAEGCEIRDGASSVADDGSCPGGRTESTPTERDEGRAGTARSDGGSDAM
jgi:hypothetical protein